MGITRARKHALIYHAGSRRIYANWQPSMPSRFLDELPEEHVARQNEGATQRRGLNLSDSVFEGGMPLTSRRRQDPLLAETAPAFQLGDHVRHPGLAWVSLSVQTGTTLRSSLKVATPSVFCPPS